MRKRETLVETVTPTAEYTHTLAASTPKLILHSEYTIVGCYSDLRVYKTIHMQSEMTASKIECNVDIQAL